MPSETAAKKKRHFSHDVYRKISSDFAKKEAEKPKVVLPESQFSSVLAAFCNAAETPIVKPVVWQDSIPEDHPIRKTDSHVCLWSVSEWTKFWQLSDDWEAATSPMEKSEVRNLQFWFVIAASLCNSAGEKQSGDLMQVAERLKQRLESPHGKTIATSIYEAALAFNGLIKEAENLDAKKS